MIGSITAKAAWVGRTASMVFGLALVVSLVIGALVGYDPASAQSTAAPGTTGSIVVDSKGDGAKTGNCTLREAIAAANTNAKVDGCKAGSATERDAIHFALGNSFVQGNKAKTIVLDSTLPTITDPSGLRINAQKAKLTISGNEQVRVFLVAPGAELALSRLTVADGFTMGFGGGLANGGGTVKVANTTFSENSANLGGGIYNEGGQITVTNSTFSNNSAEGGGGIFNSGGRDGSDGPLEVTNSTFSENSATRFGGGGIYNNDGTATLRNTIVANSTSGGNCANDPITDGGYNIDDDGSCVDESVTTSRTTDPLLDDQLAFNGGPTQTIALQPTSPALNAIPPSVNGCGTEIKTDQRGVSRPQGSGCDIGAYEKKVRSR